MTNPDAIVTTVINDVKKEAKDLTQKKPTSFKDYFIVGNYYIAKKLVLFSILAVIFLPLLYIRFLHPIVVSRFFTKTMVLNSNEQANYNGKVRLLDREGGNVIFVGRLTDGRINGEGTLYDYNGNLLYQGGFLMELYSGTGLLYYPNGRIAYKGGFSLNQYNGEGILYYETGGIQYDGSFLDGLYALWRKWKSAL